MASNTGLKNNEAEKLICNKQQFYAALTHYTTALQYAVYYNHSTSFEHRSVVLMWPLYLFMGTTHRILQIVHVDVLKDAQQQPRLRWEPLIWPLILQVLHSDELNSLTNS